MRGHGLLWLGLWAWLGAGLSACPGSGGAEVQSPSKPSAQAQQSIDTPAKPRVTLMPAGRDPVAVEVELAVEPEERRKGLMFRKHLAPDAGMLFVFERPQQLTFWMRNTYIPLDMIFIQPDMHILGIVENAEPMTDSSRAVEGESQYVLEVNAGFAREHGLTPGTAVRFDGVELPAAAERAR